MLYRLLRPLLFRLDAERAHHLVLGFLRLLQGLRLQGLLGPGPPRDPRLAQVLWGHRFPGPVGLAAGLDKDALVLPAMAALGFGFLEAGTVTPRPQAGNPRPRLFRHPGSRSLQNAMGFNNRGVEAMARRLERRRPLPVPLGVNLGRNGTTPPGRAEEDYARGFEALDGRCDYFAVNVSSPNTPGLRDLQEPRALEGLLSLGRERTGRPILVKLSPDIPPERTAALARTAVDAGAAGLILTNTTTDHALLPGARPPGGFSGRVLREASFRSLEAAAGEVGGETVLVSVGGIATGEEVYRRLAGGASLVQIYTALIYEGPGLVARLHREVLERMEREGHRSLASLGPGRGDPRAAEATP